MPSPRRRTFSTHFGLPFSPEPTDHPLRPLRPRRFVEELLDDVLFAPRCIEQYRRAYARDVPRTLLSDLLRAEVNTRGFIATQRHHVLAGRILVCVPDRFEFLVGADIGPDHPVTVPSLRFPHSRRRPRRAPQAPRNR